MSISIDQATKDALDLAAPAVAEYIYNNKQSILAEVLVRATPDVEPWLALPIEEQKAAVDVMMEHFYVATKLPRLPTVYVADIHEARKYMENLCAKRFKETKDESMKFNLSKFKQAVVTYQHLMATTCLYRMFKHAPLHYANALEIARRDAFEAMKDDIPCAIVVTNEVYVVVAPVTGVELSPGKAVFGGWCKKKQRSPNYYGGNA